MDFPFDATGPLRTRVEAFLEAQLLDDDLLRDHREPAAASADPACGVACGAPVGAGRQNEVSLDDDLGDDLFDEED